MTESTANPYRPWLHRLALLTAATALLPIVVGAVVTTVDAGMAFPDWPTSDGHGMLAYPWWQSAGDKFLEHGHRLAGMLIGIVAIGLAAAVWLFEPRRWVRGLGIAILAVVVVQGLLGGMRVLADERMMALVHGNFAAWAFTLMSLLALVTSRGWTAVARAPDDFNVAGLPPMALVAALFVLAQYALGGLVRHLGLALFSHVGFALLVAVVVGGVAWGAYRSKIGWLRQSAFWLVLLLLAQLALGCGAWVTKFGFPPAGYVAVQGSLAQTVLRTSHAVIGMLLLMTSVLHAVRVFRLAALSSQPQPIAVAAPVAELAGGPR